MMGPVVVCRMMLVPDPGCMFGLSDTSALVAKPSRITWSDEIHPAGDVLLVESKEYQVILRYLHFRTTPMRLC